MRQSGRTTKVLMEAAEAKKQGERVMIVAPNQRTQDHLVMTARNMGLLATPPGGRPGGPLDRRRDFALAQQIIEGRYRGFKGAIFEDHTVGEMLSAPKASQYYREIDMMQLMPEPEPVPPRWKFQPF